MDSRPGLRPGMDASWWSYACAGRTTSVSTSYRSGASEQRAGVVDLGADELGRSVRGVGPVTEHQAYDHQLASIPGQRPGRSSIQIRAT
ncbi:hypothetical protein BDQ94DRAFT_176418 [Aspergillus welwitschiae]|uniref:Uncharacterized protein n=1 Tax=Aspergillus welwitschiae TaxID=1341132 RepID=A0A3F3PHG3_9EURO|nr:hypothetical protein BDQ94DRAFT_176418 [Aspergillus welwitschiae]RDH26381.1 hypothetical protein BDQ94DRAFT_176418 [Aspergillus welwitschiae]